MKRLVVVESPNKVKTIRGYLPAGFDVVASVGHVRDLPSSAAEIPAALKKEKWARIGVNVEDGFTPLYIVPADKKRNVKVLKEAMKGVDELYIATDEDREGEAIGWHVLEVLKPTVPVRRMVFHEITRDAIARALENTRELDTNMVEAQEARRILDRLVGYSVSPLLWKKIAPKLSAGRVQSVAVRILVEREWERLNFVKASYWDLQATLNASGLPFTAKMSHLGKRRLASGKDFDENTGKLADSSKAFVMGEDQALGLAERLKLGSWRVATVEEKRSKRSPSAPFITTSMQAEANRKLGWSARQTMQTAQRLYEQGHITYMRTDSPVLSQEALDAARSAVERRYGKEYLSPSPRQFKGKVRNAQEAHEAVRPAGTAMRTKKDLGLGGDEAKLYDLIWKRTVASQMAEAQLLRTSAVIMASEGSEDESTFRASGQVVAFPGFFRAYVEGTDDPTAALDDRDNPLPPLAVEDSPDCGAVDGIGHETKPPARYTDATLVERLEAVGVGRPSTTASIIDTIARRGYALRQGKQLAPTFTAMATTNLLEKNFAKLVDSEFTARMESELDDIAEGKEKAQPYLERFFNGPDGLEALVEKGAESIDPRAISTMRHVKWGDYELRVGRYGPYAVSPDGQNASLDPEIAPADMTLEMLESLAGSESGDLVLGIHPDADMPMLLKTGPYGPYVQLGEDDTSGDKKAPKPKRTSLPKGVKREDVTEDMAVQLLNLPRKLGDHPDTGKPIVANLGRFGPYVQHERTYASLKAGVDDMLTVEFDRALELINEKVQKNAPLRTLGEHPDSGNPIDILSGRYGPYVKHGKTNATIPKDRDPMTVTMDEALLLLAEKEKKGGSKPKKRARKKA